MKTTKNSILEIQLLPPSGAWHYFYSKIQTTKNLTKCIRPHNLYNINPKNPGGGGWNPPIGCRYCLYSFNFHQNFSNFFLVKKFFEKLRMIEIGPRGRWKRSSICQTLHPSEKSVLPKANKQWKKKTICQIFHKKKFRKFWWNLKKWRTFFKIRPILRHMHFWL